ncbi:hypothetical protein LX32DRAFT_637591 [Colletotrichum zoysiae]|uniref:Aminodeoxychorismate lyase n=1 Tax=Colletotrichum zoysiae TaxID=1216348 RepID=A0AAD9HMN6_9PEZI|nr:hypothetical protein LX32DRAFT_637591 [Colletotrichum zoysiae]
MASNDEVEAITSDPDFEIITTFAYSTGLPQKEASPSHCYLLQYGIDRLQAAASDLSWSAVAEDLRSIDRMQSVLEEVNAYMLSTHGEASKDPSKRFIVRLAFKKDGVLSIMSGPRPNLSDPLYATTLSNIPLYHTSKITVYLDTEPTTPSPFTKHKTTYREPYNAAWKRVGLDETSSPAEYDVLLQNENGYVMGAVFRTVYLWRDGWVTPSSVTGCKMGVSRRWATENVGVKEALIGAMDISDGEMIWLSSAVGGFIRGKVTLKTRKK